ncbi:amidohydrolase family protein [Komagataeibacter pomaceti]|nr:amidohydrolase family protein [Novacetimonas pomaceti]
MGCSERMGIQAMLLVRGGTVVTAEASFRIDVLCGRGGEIAAIGPALDIPHGCRVLDAGGLLVMPGGVDPHTRIGADAGRFADIGHAALAAGTTTLIDCIDVPAGHEMRAAWEEWRHAARGGGVDFSAHMVVNHWDARMAAGMRAVTRDCGVNSFRLSCGGDLLDTQLLGVIDHALALGALCAFDTHRGQVADYLRVGLCDAGIGTAEAQALSCVPMIEDAGTARALMLAGVLGSPVHLGPVSTKGAISAITTARLHGQRTSAEVLVRHLVMTEDDDAPSCPDLPPLRAEEHRQALWGGLSAGMAGMTASGAGDEVTLTGGDARPMPDLSGRLGLLWHHGVGTGRLSVEEFVAVTSANAARAFNIYPRKGAIMVGADADLVLWDPRGEARALSSCHGAPVMSGCVRHVVRGGVLAWSGTQACGAGRGRHVARPCFGRELSARVRRGAHLAAQDG